jgi:hypothetical protein
MTRIVSILLLCGFLSQTALKIAIYADYTMNREYITLKYCENKSKPSLKCHGKCHMMKKLNEGEKKEIPSSRTEQLKYEIHLFSELMRSDQLDPITTSANFILFTDADITNITAAGIFHPPCF